MMQRYNHQSPLEAAFGGATLQAQTMERTWLVFGIAGAAVTAIVAGLIVWCLIAYRRRPDRRASEFRSNAVAPWFYVGVPLLLVIILFFVTYRDERIVETIDPHPDVRVQVQAFRWSWRFVYPGTTVAVTGTPQDPPVLELPLDQTVEIALTSVDVNHSFWVPAFLFKRDAIPGLRNVFDWHPTEIGTFRGECGEFCGLDHALMSFRVVVVPRADFERWLREHSRTAQHGRMQAAPV